MSLLHPKKNYRWDLTGIEFAIEERVGNPADFIGRVEELEYLYAWAQRIHRGISRSTAFLGRRKVGKSLILERLYNILYSEQQGLIPFYYEFKEGKRRGKAFYHDFLVRFYMQVVGYYLRDVNWIREAVDKETDVQVEVLLKEVERCSIPHKDKILYRLENCVRTMQTDKPLYEYVLSATGAPDAFATMVGVEDRVVQLLDEFQYLNMYIDAGVEKKPCKAYMSTAESRVAPLLVTGSLMAIVSQELARYLPQRFYQQVVPPMNAAEMIEMTLNYGKLYGHDITPGLAEYITYITNGIPGRIVELLTPALNKPRITTFDEVDTALEREVGPNGNIKSDWDEYLVLAMNGVNNVNMRRITYFLCQHEGEWYTLHELKTALQLKIGDALLFKELTLLALYDIIEHAGDRFGGVFDRTLKKVLMSNYADILKLPVEEFDTYFKNDNMLDYLKERVEQLELSLAEARKVRHTLDVLRGIHNDLKGHYYEQEVLLRLLKGIINDEGGLVAGIRVSAFTDTLNYHLETGEEIDVVLEGEEAVVMVECKNYDSENLDKITTAMVDEFVDKSTRLQAARFPGKELRLGFFSKYGFEQKMEDYLTQHNIVFTW